MAPFMFGPAYTQGLSQQILTAKTGPDKDVYGVLGALGEQRDLAQGKGPSVAAEQLRQGLARNVAGMASFQQSARPGQQGLATRMAAQQASKMGSEISGQSALARMMEQQAARQQYNALMLGLRGQDKQVEVANIGQPSDFDRYLGMGAGIAGAALLSDERVKTDIRPADKKADALLDGLRAYSYRYKDAKHGAGEQLGVMAQDLERAGLSQAVIETPAGKAVDGAKLAGGLAAALASVHGRVKKLEGRG